jgi:hypothetical protein
MFVLFNKQFPESHSQKVDDFAVGFLIFDKFFRVNNFTLILDV